jgi:RimJ/RimL family protein N-acetyltransferase
MLSYGDSQIYLRRFEEKDIESSLKFINDPAINMIMGYLPITYEEQCRWYQGTVGDKSRFVFAICRKSDDVYLGNVSLGNISYINRVATLSIFLADNRERKKGYGSDSIYLILDFAFDRLNLNKVKVYTTKEYGKILSLYQSDDSEKYSTIEYYKRFGFQVEGRFRQEKYLNGKYVDRYSMSVLKDEYKGKQRNN